MKLHFSKIRPLFTPLNLAVTIFVVLFIAAGIKYFLKKPDYVVVTVKGAAGNWWWVTPPPPYYLAPAIHVGDKEYDSRGKVIAEVLSMNTYATGNRKVGYGLTNKEFYAADYRDFVLRVRLMTSKDPRTQKLWFKGNTIGVGAPIEIDTKDAVINGTITEINPPPEAGQIKTLVIDLKLYSIYPWEADKVAVGDSEVDASGQKVFEVLDKSVDQAEMTVVTAAGDVLARRNPLKVDLTLRARLTGKTFGGDFYFKDDLVVKAGKILFVSLPHYDLNEIFVTGIETTP